jgi:hypothetical protein
MKLPEERPGDRCDEFRQDARLSSRSWVRNFLGLAVFAFGSISVAAGQQPAQQPTQASAAEPPAAQPAAAQAPATAEATVDASKPATPQTQEQKQLADDTAKLLILANELKAELDKSNKDTLSLGVIKKAEQVEKLAHKVRSEMKGQSAN